MHADPVEYKTSTIMPLAPIAIPDYLATAIVTYRNGKRKTFGILGHSRPRVRPAIRGEIRESALSWQAASEAAVLPSVGLGAAECSGENKPGNGMRDNLACARSSMGHTSMSRC